MTLSNYDTRANPIYKALKFLEAHDIY